MLPGKHYSHEELLRILRRRWWVALVPFLVVGTVTVAVAQLMPDLYKSETLILVVPQRVPESYVRSTVTTRIEDRLQSISQQILSRTRLERIIQDFNLYREERTTGIMEDIVQNMRKDINVQIVKGDAFTVTYVSKDRRTAMQVTERLASLFIEENLRDREVLAEGTNEFLESQLEEARRRLLENEKKLEAYRRQYAGELPSQLQSNLEVIHSTETHVQALVESINRDRDRRLVLQRQIADLTAPDVADASPPLAAAATTGPALPTAGSAAQQLQAAQNALRALELRLKPQHPDIIRLKRAIGELEKKAATEALERSLTPEPSTTKPSMKSGKPESAAVSATQKRTLELQAELEGVDQQIGSKEAEERRLRGMIADYQKRVEAVPTRESELIELTRDYETLQRQYTTLLAKKEDSKIAANLERRQIGEQFKILDPARLPEKPVSPNRPIIDLVGGLVGLGLGLGLVALLEFRDKSLRSEDDVKLTLAFPVLAMVPSIHSVADRRRIRRRTAALSLAAVAAIVAVGVAFWKLGVFHGWAT